jgi:hypothetical protein
MPRRLREKLQNLPKRQTSPGSLPAKTEIRRQVLHEIGADKARVFDAFAGDGALYRTVWHDAASYTGCDLTYYPDARECFVGDNRRVLRAIDLDAFNVFDLDAAYGSPWEQLLIIATRRELRAGEQLGFAVTEGQGMKMKLGGMSLAMSRLAGVRHYLPGLATAQEELIDRAVTRVAAMMGGKITRRWQASQKTGSVMHYLGFVMRRNGDG